MTELDLRIVSKSATPEEVAAVAAVLRAVIEEQAADASAPVTVSAWQHGQRSLRKPIRPGPGAWQRFGV